jgi:hypothetical protein
MARVRRLSLLTPERKEARHGKRSLELVIPTMRKVLPGNQNPPQVW